MLIACVYYSSVFYIDILFIGSSFYTFLSILNSLKNKFEIKIKKGKYFGMKFATTVAPLIRRPFILIKNNNKQTN